MGLVIQNVRLNHFSKKVTKVYIYEIGLHKHMMNNLKD